MNLKNWINIWTLLENYLPNIALPPNMELPPNIELPPKYSHIKEPGKEVGKDLLKDWNCLDDSTWDRLEF